MLHRVVTVRMRLPTLIVALLLLAPHVLARTVVIETPDFCTRLEKVEGTRIDLRQERAPCTLKGPHRASIQVSEEAREIDIYVNGTYWKKYLLDPQPLSVEDVADVLDGAKRYGERLSIPANRHDAKALRKAEDLSRYLQSLEFQKRIESESARIHGEIYGSRTGSQYADTSRRSEEEERLSAHERIYLFISSSVPTHTLRRYMDVISGLKEPNIRVVMRGFVGGASYVKPTVGFFKEIRFIDPGCDPGQERCRTHGAEVIIDPLLFRRYRIEKAPAFVYVPSVALADTQMSEGAANNNGISGHYVVYGDVSLGYAVRLFLRERKSPGLERLLAVCRGE